MKGDKVSVLVPLAYKNSSTSTAAAEFMSLAMLMSSVSEGRQFIYHIKITDLVVQTAFDGLVVTDFQEAYHVCNMGFGLYV